MELIVRVFISASQISISQGSNGSKVLGFNHFTTICDKQGIFFQLLRSFFMTHFVFLPYKKYDTKTVIMYLVNDKLDNEPLSILTIGNF